MTSTISSSPIRCSKKTVDRATRAVQCAPFRLKLYVTMLSQSVALTAIAGSSGIRNQYTRRSLSELVTDGELLWLIQVGLLRREVDGQGLTDSFRLTPLGRQLVEHWQTTGEIKLHPTWRDRILNTVNRWFRLPF
jgi:hypothetical protein